MTRAIASASLRRVQPFAALIVVCVATRVPMALLLTPIFGKPEEWRTLFAAEMPELELRFWPEAGNPGDIEAAAVASTMPHGKLKTFPNLRLIVSLIAGAEALLADPELPDVPI